MKQLIIVGTVREGRFTGKVADAVEEEFSKSHQTKVFDLKEEEVPAMKNRLSQTDNPPKSIERLSELVKWSDLITIVTPEYNHSIPGVLKNCLDYLYEDYTDKYFSYVTVSAGGFGGVRCQSHLNDITLALGGKPGPSMPVSNVREHFKKDEEFSEEYRRKIRSFREDCQSFIS